MRTRLMAVAFVLAVTAVGCGDDGKGTASGRPHLRYDGDVRLPADARDTGYRYQAGSCG